MTEQKPIMRASDIRAMVKEMTERGCAVRVNAITGDMDFMPASAQQPVDAFDMADMRRK